MTALLILIWGLGMIPTYTQFKNQPFDPIFEYPYDYILSFFWPFWIIGAGIVYCLYLLGLIKD